MIWLLSPIGRKIAIGAAVVAFIGAGLWWVRYDAVRDDRAAREAAEADRFKATTERMNNADTAGGDDAEWLRKRGQR